MKYNIYELKNKPIVNWSANFYWHLKLTKEEITEWENFIIEEFYEKYPQGTVTERNRYIRECAFIIDEEYIAIHLPGEL